MEALILFSADGTKAILPLLIAIKAAAFGAKKHGLKHAGGKIAGKIKHKPKKRNHKRRERDRNDEEE